MSNSIIAVITILDKCRVGCLESSAYQTNIEKGIMSKYPFGQMMKALFVFG